ncbi:MAG TPA: hypothetical protein VFU06_01780 [Longimicrobiales bacterium]|nr:hypothetical protein [Longimicrobiales bacterium]
MRAEHRLTRTLLLILTAAACSDGGDPAGPTPNPQHPDPTPGLTLSVSSAPPGTVIALTGVPASASPETHWIEVAGERAPLILEQGEAAFVVPAFLDEATMWPAPPTGAQDVALMSASGTQALAAAALTVRPLEPADGTTALVVHAVGIIGPTLAAAANAMPAGTGEPRRFLQAIGGGLDSLAASPDVALQSALAELQSQPEQLRLLDALLASSGNADRILRFSTTLLRVVNGLSAEETDGAFARLTSKAVAGDAIDVLSDEMLSELMQLAVYLEQNVEFQNELGSDLSSVLSLASVLGIDADKVAPIGKVLDAIGVLSSLQALVVKTYVLSALPSRLDSLTVELARDTISPEAVTDATVKVFASNEPDPVSLGDYFSVFQNVAGLFAKGDYFEKAAHFLIGKSSDLLKWIADNDDSFEYDSNLLDLWSLPDASFEATIVTRELVVLKAADQGVVAPLETQVNWTATALDSGSTTVTVEPSIGPANIPVLMEWFADFISENSGSASDLVLGAFGADIVASEPVEVWVAPNDEEILFTFDSELEGWEPGTIEESYDEDEGWGTSEWQEWCGDDREEGCVKLDGTGGGGRPNAWIERDIEIPASASMLSFLTSPHNRNGSGSDYRIRLVDAGGAAHTLIDWTSTSGSAPDLSWEEVSVSIAPWAGQTVRFFFEGRDNGPGSHEQRYYDDIRIH